MTEQIRVEFQKEIQIHQSAIHVIQNQLNGLLSFHEDLHLCMDDIHQYSERFQEMKKQSEQTYIEYVEQKNIPKLSHSASQKMNNQVPSSTILIQDDQSQKDPYTNLSNILNQDFCFSFTNQDLQMRVGIQFLSFVHKNILAQILVTLVTIEKHIGVKDFKEILDNDVTTAHVQCKKLLIVLDYIDKWMEIKTEKDCVFNPNLQKIALSASIIQDISSNCGIDIDQQHQSFLNLIYSTYALIYEHGLEQQLERKQNISLQQENNHLSQQQKKEEQDKINYINEQNEIQTKELQDKQENLNQQSGISRKKKTIGSFSMMYKSMKFLIKKEQAKKLTELLQMNPTTDQIIDAWRMYEIVPEVKAMFSLQLDRITFSEKFYFPRFTKRIDLRYILQNANKYFSLPQNIGKQEALQIQEKIEQCISLTKFVPSYNNLIYLQQTNQYLNNPSKTDLISNILYKKDNVYQQRNSQGRSSFMSQKSSFQLNQERSSPKQLQNIRIKDKEQRIKVRILSSTNLDVINDENESSESILDKLQSMMCIGRNKPSSQQNVQQTYRRHNRAQNNQQDLNNLNINYGNRINKHVILHIHGGGFVSMNSFSHQIYTRKWANSIEDCIVISVDYRKSPENRYPSAIDDIWQVYNFIIYHLEDVIQNLHISSIILAGDSAGGNLCLSLMNLIVQEDIQRKPNGILLSYPALNLNGNNFTLSSLHSLKDIVLPPTFLKICLSSYLPNTPEYLSELFVQYDTLLSPILIPDKILAQFPPIHLFCGEQDPLFDDTLRFFHRIRLLKDPVYQSVYQNIQKQTKTQQFNDRFLQQNMLKDNLIHFKKDLEEHKESNDLNKINDINSLQQQHQSAQFIIYQKLKHGYLNLDFPFGMPIVRNCVDQTINSLKILIQQASINQINNVPLDYSIRSSLIRSYNSKLISDSQQLNSDNTEKQPSLFNS